jgi:very-short-patch-repair endonuclease
VSLPVKGLRELDKSLRKNQTDAEGYLWQFLRDRRLAGYKFRRQYPCASYILDFYYPQKKLAIEFDGGQPGTVHGLAYDQHRTSILEDHGIKVLRYWDAGVFQNTNGILEDIIDELERR